MLSCVENDAIAFAIDGREPNLLPIDWNAFFSVWSIYYEMNRLGLVENLQLGPKIYTSKLVKIEPNSDFNNTLKTIWVKET